jgi:SAM-dependent methyltransferase
VSEDERGLPGSPAGDVDYQRHGVGYALRRRTDPSIAAVIWKALGTARTVLNVGAGAGSYEPTDRHVLAVEPSAAMRAQRPAHLLPAIDAVAERLPLDDESVDASMALVTVHQWADLRRGLRELRRVTRGPVVVLAFDPDALDAFWLAEYAPELMAALRRRDPPLATIREGLGGATTVERVPIVRDCLDGFTEAFHARPESYLDPAVRRSQSSWAFLDEGCEERIVARLREDLESGAWDARFGTWRAQPQYEGSLRLIVSRRDPVGDARAQ